MPRYVLSDKAPAAAADKGSGPWCSAPQTAKFLVYKRAIEFALDTHAVDLTIGADAVAHMRHYLANTGHDYTLDMPAVMVKSSKLRLNQDDEVAQARAFSETLPVGLHDISSSTHGYGSFSQVSDRNLFFAIGSYTYWGQGRVRVEPVDVDKRRYTLDFEFHFFDRYNWDKGKSVTIAGMKVSDEFMQDFHRQCYAREFDLRGVARQRVVWDAPLLKAPAAPLPNPFDVLFNQ